VCVFGVWRAHLCDVCMCVCACSCTCFFRACQDRLGWFDDASIDIETIMREKGEQARWVESADGSLEAAFGELAAAPSATPTPMPPPNDA
jgi:hypothetical protein